MTDFFNGLEITGFMIYAFLDKLAKSKKSSMSFKKNIYFCKKAKPKDLKRIELQYVAPRI